MNKAKIWIGSALLSVYVGLFAYIGIFSMPSGDDYTGYFNTYSFLQAIIHYWFYVGSRFTGAVIVTSGNIAGIMDNYYIVAPLALTISLLSLYFLVTSLFERLATISKLFMTLLLQSVWLAAAIALKQSLYWLSGLNYYWTSSFFLIELALIVNIYNDKNTKLYLWLLGIMVFLNSGMSELSAAYQIPMFAGAALIAAASGSKKYSRHMLVMLCIALAGLVLQLTSPGNTHRASETLHLFGPNPAPITKSIFMTYRVGIIGGLVSSYRFFTRPIIYALLLFMPVISDNVKQPAFAGKMPFRFKIWHIFLFQIVTACCFQAVAGYAMGNALYPRAMSVMRWIMLTQWILFFVYLYRNPKFTEWIRGIRIYRFSEIILLICLLTSANFSNLTADLSIAPEYSRQLAERREFIKEQKALGVLNLVVPTIDLYPRIFIKDSIPAGESPVKWSYFYYHALISIKEETPLAIEFLVEGHDSENEELKRLKAEADAGDETALLFFKTIEGDEEARIKLIISMAEGGHPTYMFLLARYYDTSDNLTNPYIEENDALALEYYFKLAEIGHRDAREILWTFYMGGFRTDRDSDVIKWGLMSMLNPF